MSRNHFKRGIHQTTTPKGEASKMVERVTRMIKNETDPAKVADLYQTLRYWKRRA